MEPITSTIKMLIEENHKNEETFNSAYDKAWDGYLFRYPDGKLIPPDALTKKFAHFLKANNMKQIRFHDLRHSCASILFANGVDLLTIQKILGHAQLTTTMIYTHSINNMMDKALRQMGAQLTGESAKKEVE